MGKKTKSEKLKLSPREKMVAILNELIAFVHKYFTDVDCLKSTLHTYKYLIENDEKIFKENANTNYFYSEAIKNAHAYERTGLVRYKHEVMHNLLEGIRAKIKSVQSGLLQHSRSPFLYWLHNQIRCYRYPASINMQEYIPQLVMGQKKPMLIILHPETYMQQISDMIKQAHEKFQEQDPTKLPTEYTDIITETDVRDVNLIADRVRGYVEKNKPFPKEKLDELAQKFFTTLIVLFANVFLRYNNLEKTKQWCIQETAQDIDEKFHYLLTEIKKLFFRTRIRELETELLNIKVDKQQKSEDFSPIQLSKLTSSIKKKKTDKKPIKPVRQQKKTTSLHVATTTIKQQQQQQQQQQQVKPGARVSFQEWVSDLPLVIPPVRGLEPLLQRKNRNIELLQDKVSGLAQWLMKEASFLKSTAILLVDVRNLATEMFPDQSFQQKSRKFLQHFRGSNLQREYLDQLGVDMRRPFVVYVDQGDGWSVETIDTPDKILVRVPCVKPHDGNMVNCHQTLQKQQQQQKIARKNPMDDYVLLSLYSILNRYYNEYIAKVGGMEQRQLEQIQQFVRCNPGVTRYLPSMAVSLRNMKKEVRQHNKKIASHVPPTFIFSKDMFKDWRIGK